VILQKSLYFIGGASFFHPLNEFTQNNLHYLWSG